MKLIVLGCDGAAGMWQYAFSQTGMEGRLAGSRDMQEEAKHEELLRMLREGWDLCLLYGSHSDSVTEKLIGRLPEELPLIPVGSEAAALDLRRRGNNGGARKKPAVPAGSMAPERGGAEAGSGGSEEAGKWSAGEVVERVNRYLLYGGRENYLNLCRYLLCLQEERQEEDCPLPQELPFEGMYFPEDGAGGKVCACWEEYAKELTARGEADVLSLPRAGLISHRSSWISDDLSVEAALSEEFRKRGIYLVCAFHSGAPDPAMKNHSLQELMDCFFRSAGLPVIGALVNLSVWGAVSQEGCDLFEETARLYREWNLPVFYPLVSLFSTEEMLASSREPLAAELPWLYLQPEMQGMAEPVLIACRDGKGRTQVLPGRAGHFAGRAARWMRMRGKRNGDKRVALILHNAVCSGVEATIGQAYGLDAFESTAAILKRLKEEGYQTGVIPETGRELYDLIRERKAMSDFRWTAVEDIVEQGGCLYRMDCEKEYLPLFRELEPSAAEQMEQAWGAPPGEGMVLDGTLVVSGLRFQNVLVMVQPKRGCHKAKCTGEVCKILHDPYCPPPHQYLASYRYIQDIFDADCCVHVGTEGSTEYLPGKSNGLTGGCWPDIVMGGLPNLYLYHSGVPAEAAVAKRRAYAVLVGYLPMPGRGCGEEYLELNRLIDQYREAVQLKNGQEQRLEAEIRRSLEGLEAARRTVEGEESLERGLDELQRLIRKLAGAVKGDSLHVFGRMPDVEECLQYAAEIWENDEEFRKLFQEEDSVERSRLIQERIRQAWVREEPEDELDYSADQILEGLKCCPDEMDSLMNGLCGGYIPPGECGMPDENGLGILPTGRNLHLSGTDRIPVKSAWERGKELADQLIELYRGEEGALPRKVAMNMMSLDVTRSKGEQLSQFLYLMGITPLWDAKGRVIGLAPIPLEQLGRPRIDVTVRITGVLRDTWPFVVEMMDEAVLLAASLEEPEEVNYVRANMKSMNSTVRIFGDAPGAYGAGVDLALMASAWESEEDLMRYYIKHSAYAYGKELHGETRIQEFVDNVKDVDVSYDVTESPRMDVLECGFGTQVQGGMRLMAKYLGKKKIRQYQGVSERGRSVRTESLSARYRRSVEETLLNSLWREEKKKQGYQGAGNFMFRLQNLFMDQCLNELLPDEVIDQVAEACMNAPDMQEFFRKENPYAMEEAARRFLELHQRGKWNGDPEVLTRLQEAYLEAEGDVECGLASRGEIQGGSVEIQNDAQVESWRDKMREVDQVLAGMQDSSAK